LDLVEEAAFPESATGALASAAIKSEDIASNGFAALALLKSSATALGLVLEYFLPADNCLL
jgi:hypothetical protein